MYVNITYRRGEVSKKASEVDGINTKSYCVQDWLGGGEGCTVVVWNAALSGIKSQLEQRIGITLVLFIYITEKQVIVQNEMGIVEDMI